MATLTPGQNTTITIAAGMPIRISTTGDATVELITGGSVYDTDRLSGYKLSQVYGPFPVSTQVRIRAIAGNADYGGGYYDALPTNNVLSQQRPIVYNLKTAAQLNQINVALAASLASYPFGYRILVDGVSYTLEGLGVLATFMADSAGNVVIGIGAPNSSDGRPDNTIYIQVAS
jgi:hypothetical protein